MPGVSHSLSYHKLNVSLHHKPVKQKRRTFNQERYDTLEQEVDRLLIAGFIREAMYPDWVSNIVLVKKLNGKCRMCVDFTGLNKSCLKDSFPLPRWTSWLMQQRDMRCLVLWIPSPVTIKSQCTNPIKTKRPSSPIVGYTVIRLCRLV